MLHSNIEKPDLKDILDIDDFLACGYKKICICAGVGAGKSTWVDKVLASKGNVLCITSRKAPVEQGTKPANTLKKYYTIHANSNQALITNAKLTSIIKAFMINTETNLDEFLDAFDFIVVDEAHSIATDATFAESSMGVFSFIKYAINKGKVVILMTGTKEPINNYLLKDGWLVLNYLDKCKYVHPAEVHFIKRRNVERKIVKQAQSGKVIYFMNHVSDIAETYKNLISNPELSLDNIKIVVAEARRAELYKELKTSCKSEIEKLVKAELIQLGLECNEKNIRKGIKAKFEEIKKGNEALYESITTDNTLPESCKVLLSTSVLREGVNIFNTDMTMICDNHIVSNLIQFFGRVRLEGTKVYIVEDSSDHKIEKDDWLYSYAYYEAAAANEYMDKLATSGDLFGSEEIYLLISHLQKCNKYIFFDWVDKQFKVSDIRYQEECRLAAENCNWVKTLQQYCEHYNIPCAVRTNQQIFENELSDLLERAIEKRIKFFKKEQSTIINIINDACHSNVKQISKLNLEIEKKGLPVELVSYTETQGERRDDTYWMAVRKNRKCENF